MTKAELVEKVAEKIQLTKKQTEAVVNIMLTCITEALSEGDKVELRGFGSFRIRNRKVFVPLSVYAMVGSFGVPRMQSRGGECAYPSRYCA